MNSDRGMVLISGASSGIGEALARRFAREGWPLVLVARSVGKLEALAEAIAAEQGVKVIVQGADLAAPGAAPELAAALKRRRARIDVLVNNAGVLEHGEFARMKPAAHDAMIELNVRALTALIAAFVPPMVRRGGGRVLNVASIASFQPVPSLATYAATKAFVLSLTESLAEELAPAGVTVTALCPGITATAMLSSAARGNPALVRLPGFVVGSADEVADAGVRGCLAGEVIVIPGAVNLAATWASRATPRWLLRKLSGAVARGTRRG
jgi:hypothetical protein